VNQLILIAAGGAAGALARFGLSKAVYGLFGTAFPWGTLAVNTLGSLLIGFLSVLFADRLSIPPELKAGLLAGVLGALTTFSTFSLETFGLLEQGELGRALANVLANVVLCLLLTWLGVTLARQL
jgi:CrcB protein